MGKLIKSGDELYQYFMDCSRPFMVKRIKAIPYNGVMVKTSVRADVMTNERQGKITIGGTVKRILFESLGGGVWLAKLEESENA